MRNAVAVVVGVFTLLVALAATASADAPERRHASGIVLLPPLDVAAIVRQGPMYEPLARAWSDARDLAQMNPDVLGYPWADRAKGELVVAVTNAQGEQIARSWIAAGAPRNLGKPAPDLQKPQVPVRLRTVPYSFRQLETIMHAAIGKGAVGFAGENRVWQSGVDEEHQRVVLTVDRVVDSFLAALAKTYGTEVVAVQVDPRAHAFASLAGGAAAPNVAAGTPEVARELALVGGLAAASVVPTGLVIVLVRRRRIARSAS